MELVERKIDKVINLRNNDKPESSPVRDSTLSEKWENEMMERRYEVNWMDGGELRMGWFCGGGEEAL